MNNFDPQVPAYRYDAKTGRWEFSRYLGASVKSEWDYEADDEAVRSKDDDMRPGKTQGEYMAIAQVGYPEDGYECFVTDGEWVRMAWWSSGDAKWKIALGPQQGDCRELWFEPTHWVMVTYPWALAG